MTGGIFFMIVIRSVTHLIKAGIAALREKTEIHDSYQNNY